MTIPPSPRMKTTPDETMESLSQHDDACERLKDYKSPSLPSRRASQMPSNRQSLPTSLRDTICPERETKEKDWSEKTRTEEQISEPEWVDNVEFFITKVRLLLLQVSLIIMNTSLQVLCVFKLLLCFDYYRNLVFGVEVLMGSGTWGRYNLLLVMRLVLSCPPRK